MLASTMDTLRILLVSDAKFWPAKLVVWCYNGATKDDISAQCCARKRDAHDSAGTSKRDTRVEEGCARKRDAHDSAGTSKRGTRVEKGCARKRDAHDTAGMSKRDTRVEKGCARKRDAHNSAGTSKRGTRVEKGCARKRDAHDSAGTSKRGTHESKFIQKIVKVIEDKLNRKILSVAPCLIRMDYRVTSINLWLQDESTDVGVLVICGMGGIGKTTIAKFVYNLNYRRFEGSSFLANIREVSEQPNGLVRLQRQLLSDILKRKKENIHSVDEGIIKIKDVVSCKRSLVVLDDVDQVDQLDALIGIRDLFHPGSKVIITTRHERLLQPHKDHEVHNVEKLDEDESCELFSLHAFGQNHPIKVFMEHSKRVVQYCGGFPLALQVLCSSLSGKSVDVWESALEKLETIPESQIVNKLKISYDSLQDDHDKNLFLHIACFFVRKDKDFSVRILDECDFYTSFGIQNLIDRCLVTIDKNNKMMMHQLLQDMGREIIRQESPKEPGKHNRLWHHKDSFNVLREKTISNMLLMYVDSFPHSWSILIHGIFFFLTSAGH
ncbi:hypothetical protein ACSBR1_019002 [Camellia fascicularis]